MPRPLSRPVITFAPTDGSQIRQPMPLGSMIAGYKVRFTGNLVVTVAATLREDAPLNYLKSVDLVLGGSFPLRVHDARFINFWNRYTRGTANRVNAPAVGVGTNAFSAEFIVDLTDPSLHKALYRAMLLDTRPLSRVELVFTTGAVADLISAGTATLSALSIQITALEWPELAGILSRQQVGFTQQAISATGVLDLPPFTGGGTTYRALAMHFTSGNADPVQATSDDTILADATLIDSRGLRYWDAEPYEQIRAENKRLRQLETMPAGWVVLDANPFDDFSDLIQTRGFQNLTLRLNIAAAPANSIVRVYPVVILHRRRANGPSERAMSTGASEAGYAGPGVPFTPGGGGGYPTDLPIRPRVWGYPIYPGGPR